MIYSEDKVTKNEVGYFEIGNDRLLVLVLYSEENLDERKCSKCTLVALNSDKENFHSSQAIQNYHCLPVTFNLPMMVVSVENQKGGQSKLQVVSEKFAAEGLVESDKVYESAVKLHYRVIKSAVTEEELEMIEKGSSEGLLTFEFVEENALKEDKKKLNRLLSTALDYHTKVVPEKDSKD